MKAITVIKRESPSIGAEKPSMEHESLNKIGVDRITGYLQSPRFIYKKKGLIYKSRLNLE
jgi:hypothetical protein